MKSLIIGANYNQLNHNEAPLKTGFLGCNS